MKRRAAGKEVGEITVTVHLSEGVLAGIDNLADETERSRMGMIQYALRCYVFENDGPLQETVKVGQGPVKFEVRLTAADAEDFKARIDGKFADMGEAVSTLIQAFMYGRALPERAWSDGVCRGCNAGVHDLCVRPCRCRNSYHS